ncbi:helix-turn-helix domain-containing protein [Enterococcus alishanensis]
MDTYNRIKELAKEKHISIRQLEINFGYSNGYIGSWKRQTPNSTELTRLADYFNVSTDYLLGRTDNKNEVASSVSDADLEDILDGVMSWNGQELTQADKEAVRIFLAGRKSK